MSSAGTTLPGRGWVASKPPTYNALSTDNVVVNRDLSPELFKPPSNTKFDPNGTSLGGRTLNTYKRVDAPGILKKGDGDPKKQVVRFSEREPQESGGREIVKAKLGAVTVTTTKPYETVVAERDALQESDKVYRKRIKQLEEENASILLDYESVYKENNLLRDKLDKGDGSHVESYQRVYADRQILREAEVAYKRRISQLEQDAKDMLKNFESMYNENKVLRDKAKMLNDRLNSVDRAKEVKKLRELERKTQILEKNLISTRFERDELLKERHQLDNQIHMFKEEISELNRSNMLLERENEALKRGIKALGNEVDESWKKELKQKTRRMEEEERMLRTEHAEFRKEIERLTSEVHRLEKINVESTTKIKMLQADKADYEQRLLEMTREHNKRTPSGVRRRDAEAAKQNVMKLEDMKEKMEALTNENVELKTNIKMMFNDHNALEKRLQEAEKLSRNTASSIRRKVETEREMKELNMQNEKLQEEVKLLENQNKDLKDKLHHLEVDSKIQRRASEAMVSGQASQVETQMRNLNKKINSLTEELKSVTEENIQLKAEYKNATDKLKEKLEQLENEKKTLKQEIETLRGDIDQSESTSSGKMQKLKDEIDKLNLELEVLRPKHQDLQKTFEELKAENKSNKDKLEAKMKELETVKDMMRDNKDVFNDLSNSQKEAASLKAELEKITEKYNSERSKLQSDLRDLQKNHESVNKALSENTVRLEMLQQERNNLKEENLKLVKDNERLNKSVTDLKDNLEKVSGEGTTATNHFKWELDNVRKELKASETALIKTKQELETAKNERENQVSKLLKQMEVLKTEREAETKQLKDQSDSLRSEIARLKVFEERMKNMEASLKDLIQKLIESDERNSDGTKEKIMSLQEVIKDLKSENTANRTRAAEYERNELQKSKLENDIKQDAMREIQRLTEENGRLMGLIEEKKVKEKEQEELAQKTSKFNELVGQNKRLQDENTRLLKELDGIRSQHLDQKLQDKTEKLAEVEIKYQQSHLENVQLRQTVEQHESELKELRPKAEQVMNIQHDNRRLEDENKLLRSEMLKKDNEINRLKELERVHAKYVDTATNNQQLYEENRRLRGNIEKLKHFETEFVKAKESNKNDVETSLKLQQENELLKATMEIKEKEWRRELEIHQDRGTNNASRIRRLNDELTRLRADLVQKDDLIIKLRAFETAENKLKDAAVNVSRLYEENQRLRSLLEMAGGDWKAQLHKPATLSRPKSSEARVAQYVDTAQPKKKKALNKILDPSLLQELLHETNDHEHHTGHETKTLPDINDGKALVTGLNYSDIHLKSKHVKNDKVIHSLHSQIESLKEDKKHKEHEVMRLTEELDTFKTEYHRLSDEKKALKEKVAKLMKDHEASASGMTDHKLREKNRRLHKENQRLRDELSMRDLQLSQYGSAGYSIAQYVDHNAKPEPNTEEKLQLATIENKRLKEENDSLRASLEEMQKHDTGSRFKNPHVTGSMIEGYKKAKKWATTSHGKAVNRRKPVARPSNETDDTKLLKIDEVSL